jgi:hypothetical protein
MLPEFPKFKSIEISDKEDVEKITKKYPPYSDFNFVSMWSWDIKGDMRVSTFAINSMGKSPSIACPIPEKPNFVNIGNDVWIGDDVTIFSGVTIHNGACIGAGSVVRKEIPAYAIARGNPATVVRYRFSQEDINTLQSLQWWNWPEEFLRKAGGLLLSSDVQGLKNAAKYPEHRQTEGPPF